MRSGSLRVGVSRARKVPVIAAGSAVVTRQLVYFLVAPFGIGSGLIGLMPAFAVGLPAPLIGGLMMGFLLIPRCLLLAAVVERTG